MAEGTIFNSFMNTIVQRLDAGYAFLTADVMWLFNALVVVQLTLAGVYWALGARGHIVADMLRRILLIGFILFFIDRFPYLVDTIAETAVQMGLNAGGGRVTRAQMLDPGHVANRGWMTAVMIWAEVSRLSGPVDTLVNIREIVLLFVAGFVVLVSFLAVALQMFFAIVTLKLGALVCYVLLPFAVFPGTSFMAERAMGWLVTSAVRLMLITLVVSVSFSLFAQFTVDNPEAVQLREAVGLAVGGVIFFVFSWQASRLAQDLASGSPSFGLGSAFGLLAGTSAVGVAAVSAARPAAQLVGSGMRSAPNIAVRAAARAPSPSTTTGTKPPASTKDPVNQKT
jgi:type IV secretion system protein TrbL